MYDQKRRPVMNSYSYCDEYSGGDCAMNYAISTATTCAESDTTPTMPTCDDEVHNYYSAFDAYCYYVASNLVLCADSNSNFASNTAAWSSNMFSNLDMFFLAHASNTTTYASNTASFASNWLSNLDILCCEFASNTAAWTSNHLSNYDPNFASNTAAWTSNRLSNYDPNFASNTAAWTSNLLSNLPLLIKTDPALYTPSTSNNTSDLNHVIVDPDEIKWLIDIRGYATQIGVVHAIGLMVSQANDQVIPDSISTELTNWGSADTDTTLSGWDSATGTLTVPRGGIYRAEARAVYNSAVWPVGSQNSIAIGINGVVSEQSMGLSYTCSTDNIAVRRASSPAQGVFNLIKGDTISVMLYQSTGADQSTFGKQCVLTVSECPP